MSVASSTKAFYSRNSDVNLFSVEKLQSVSRTLKFCQHFDDIIENESVKIIEGTIKIYCMHIIYVIVL